MAYLVATIVAQVAADLEDAGFTRWSQDDFVAFYNRAVASVCRHKPDAYTVRGNVQLVAGPIQSLPALGHRLIRPTRNMGANGSDPGSAIRLVDLDSQVDFDPSWYVAEDSTEVSDVLYDDAHPEEFFVYPPAVGYYIEILYAAVPAQADIDGTLPLKDIYYEPVQNFMKGYALQGNRSDADFNKANGYLALAFSGLGLQMQNEKMLKLASAQS